MRCPHTVGIQRKKALLLQQGFSVDINAGDHLISHTVARAVPSAQRGLTSVFGMGTGDPSQYGHRQTSRRLAKMRREAMKLVQAEDVLRQRFA